MCRGGLSSPPGGRIVVSSGPPYDWKKNSLGLGVLCGDRRDPSADTSAMTGARRRGPLTCVGADFQVRRGGGSLFLQVRPTTGRRTLLDSVCSVVIVVIPPVTPRR